MQIKNIKASLITGDESQTYEVMLRDLAKAAGLKKIMVHEESLQPGSRNSRSHYHTSKEEMIVVLEGCLRVNCGATATLLEAGAIFGFTPGTGDFHQVINEGEKVARFLSIGNVDPKDEVVFQQSID